MPVLGYWKIRGLGQSIRFLLHYVGEEFEDKQYIVKKNEDGSINREHWLNEKFELGLDFPNLPYYIDDTVKLTQSMAIMRHLGRKYNLNGKTPEQENRMEMAYGEVNDLKLKFTRLCYSDTFADQKADFLKSTPAKLAEFEKFLGDRNYLAGDEITIVDFVFYETLSAHLALESTLLDACPKLQAYRTRFENKPKIKKYMESEGYIKSPYNSPFAPGFPGVVA